MKIMLTLAAVAAAISLGWPGAASPANRTIQAAISTADLDLSNAAGIRALDRRIALAAKALCGEPSSADPRGRTKSRHCRSFAHDSIAAQRSDAIAAAGAGDLLVVAQRR